MLALRAVALKSEISRSTARRALSVPVKRALVKAGQVDEAAEDTLPVERRMREMSEKDPALLFDSGVALPDPVLPDNVAEMAAVDPAQKRSMVTPDGRERTVTIRQLRARPNQSPLNFEKVWKISFNDDGTYANRWKNPLMDWNSTADPMASDPPLYFSNAAEAVYFAEKRGWNHVVKRPIVRKMRSDGAQYQDNFLSQAIAGKIKREGTHCVQWERDEAGTSHYFRPLNYHGSGTVRQHGPNPHEASVPHVDGYYKSR